MASAIAQADAVAQQLLAYVACVNHSSLRPIP